MKVLWSMSESSVADVVERLPSRLAYTTISTMLRKLESRGLVQHRQQGRTFLYRAAVPAEAVTHSMANHFIDRLFEGKLTDAISHLLTSRQVSREELAELERLIARHKKKR